MSYRVESFGYKWVLEGVFASLDNAQGYAAELYSLGLLQIRVVPMWESPESSLESILAASPRAPGAETGSADGPHRGEVPRPTGARSPEESAMESAIKIKINPQDAVPQDSQERLEFLERYGVLPGEVELAFTASLAEWTELGVTLDARGGVSHYSYEFAAQVRSAALAIIRGTGCVPEYLPQATMEAVVAKRKAKREEEEAELAVAKAKRAAEVAAWLAAPYDVLAATVGISPGIYTTLKGPDLPEINVGRDSPELTARAKAAAAANLAAAEKQKAEREADRAAWIVVHGSPRLQRLVAEKIEHDAVYRDERLALELPGWEWYSRVSGDDDEARNATEGALVFLDEARKQAPTAKLAYWVHNEHGEYGATSSKCIAGCKRPAWRGYVALVVPSWTGDTETAVLGAFGDEEDDE
jgi:hypothetical protein